MRRALWAAAVLLGIAGIVMYLVWQTSWGYWVGGAMLVPLTLLILTSTTEQTDSTHFGDPGSGSVDGAVTYFARPS